MKHAKNIKEIDIRQVSKEDIKRYLETKQTHIVKGEIVPYSCSYYNAIVIFLRRFFEYLYDNEYINNNIIKSFELKKNMDEVKRYYITGEQLKEICEYPLTLIPNAELDDNCIELEAVQYRHVQRQCYIILGLIVETGIRAQTLLEINREDFDVESQKISVIGKGGKKKTYKLTQKLSLELEYWVKAYCWYLIWNRKNISPFSKNVNVKEEKQKHSYMFVGKNGDRMEYNELIRMVKKYTKAVLGYPVSPDKLRSAFATVLYEEIKDTVLDIEECKYNVAIFESEIQIYDTEDNQEYILSKQKWKQAKKILQDDIYWSLKRILISLNKEY